MANAGAMSAQMLPRFLLPRLSWQSSAPARQGVQPMRAVIASQAHSYTTSRDQKCRPSSRIVVQHVQKFKSSSPILQNLPQQCSFHATSRRSRDHHFDTLKFVQRLREEGFTEAQSVAMMKVLSDVIEER
jgi:hypothetical protein